MVVYTNRSSNYCQFFKIGTLKIANRSNNKGTKIGFKIRDRFSSTVCPVDDTVGGKGYSFDNYPYSVDRYYNGYTFTYNKESASWNFNSTGRLGCPIFMQRLFMRPAGLWCIGVVNATKCAAYEGVLSGIDSMEEFDFIQTMKSMRIGGTRKKSCIGNTTCKGIDAFEFVDPTVSKNSTGYSWHPGKPANEDCLAFTKRDDGSIGIEDVSCTKNTVPGKLHHDCDQWLPANLHWYSDLALSWEDCLAYCMKNETCMVVYNKDDGCQMFEIGNLQAVKRDPDTRIAFKVVNKNGTCPASDMEPGKGYMFGVNETSERQIYIGYDINYDQNTESWKLNSTGVNISPRVKMFMRDAGPWCIVMVTNSFCSNHTAMAASCRTLRGQGGELSGFETPEEFEFMKERVNISGWLNATNNRNSALWMDGVRKPECVGNPSCQGLSAFKLGDPYLSANPTGFMFNPGQPNGTTEDCLGFVVNPDKTVGVVSTLCTLTRPGDNSTCYLGYICGMTPS